MMRCPYCGKRTGVIDTQARTCEGVSTQERRRQCRGCGRRFNTFELAEADEQERLHLPRAAGTEV